MMPNTYMVSIPVVPNAYLLSGESITVLPNTYLLSGVSITEVPDTMPALFTRMVTGPTCTTPTVLNCTILNCTELNCNNCTVRKLELHLIRALQ